MRALTSLALAAALSGLAGDETHAQALTGTMGLVAVPTAEMPADGALAAGLNLVARGHHGYALPGHADEPLLVQYLGVGFLPFVEVGLRLTRMVNVPRQALGDRMVSIRVRLVEEGAYAPAVVLGAHDLTGTRFFHSIYLVGSRHLGELPGAGRAGAHLGYGGDLLGLEPRWVQFDGVFGGLSLEPHPSFMLMAEHDTERVNVGTRARILGRVTLLVSVQGMSALSGGIGYTHRLL